jgi:uncharacterized protein
MHYIRMWIDRQYAASIERILKGFPALLLTGPRQVGKTSLLKHLYPQHQYVSFDHPAMAQKAEGNPDAFFESLKEPVILDEIQYVPTLFRYLKNVIDNNRKAGRFILTGSQSFPLMQEVSESLAGRCGILEMHSLSFDEIKSHDESFSEKKYLIRGGFPELYKSNIQDSEDWYGAYLATYLERDVRNIRNVGDLRNFERLLRAVAARTGQVLSYADLARDVGVAPNTAKQWISVLQASGQIFLLEPYYRNMGKRLVKSPKLYVIDTGLACSLVGIQSWEDFVRSPMAGNLWETFIIGEVIRSFHSKGKKPPLWFWQTNYGDEVDLLIEKGGRFVAIECKMTETPKPEHFKGLKVFQNAYGEDAIERSYLACRSKTSFLRPNENVEVIPGSSIAKKKLIT